MTNELAQENSPYLLQHAQNPVHWKAWNPKSLALAKTENKLILVSIGYSACHWCHVMEHESFENQEVADVMNPYFINIKVDREERPDVDAVYMKAVQLMTGRGGWPLNVVCLPDGRPVWGGTYFRKDEWMNTLSNLNDIYINQPEKMVEYAEKLQEGISYLGISKSESSNPDLHIDIVKPLLEKWQKSFDLEYGGYSRAPKFMMPTNYSFLLAYGFLSNDKELLDYVDLTLTKMAYGGIFDPVDGGFSRYSVDDKWHVPHFEKMAYDNGQLLSLYANAYSLTKNELYREVIEKTTTFIEKEWLMSYGGFYSALDADSLNHNGKLEEGAFYVWTLEELKNILKDDFELFAQVFNCNDFGHWEHGNYVLIQTKSLDVIASENAISIIALKEKKKAWEKILYDKRELRPKPRLDDKCITAWNAILLKGFVESYKALGNKHYLELALKNADFITKKLWSPEGHLYRIFKNEKASINGFLEDYAFVIEGFISLYEVTFDDKWLLDAKNLTNYCFDHFYDETEGFFRFTSNLDEALIAPNFEIEDNVIPSSNSVMGENLFRLSVYYENPHYESVARKMLEQVVPSVDYPSAFSNWFSLLLHYSDFQKELAICGEYTMGNLKILNATYLPHVLIAGTEKESNLPFLKNRFVTNEILYYICQQKACLAPEKDFEKVLKEIKSFV
jgi:uncharacterized protein